MPINWNEVDKARLEYIQNKEDIEAEYRKECLACENSFFRFKKPERPKELDSWYYDEYQLYKDQFISVEGDRIVFHTLDSLPKNIQDIIIRYLDAGNKILILPCGDEKYYKFVNDTEENRKKLDKVVALIEKYTSKKQKEAEAYIDNYINSKDTK